MLQAVLFDMDGVLFDTESVSARADHIVAAQMGFELPLELQNQFYGATNPHITALIQAHFGPDFPAQQYLQRSLLETERLVDKEGLVKMPGVDEALAWLSQNGYRLAVASSSRSPKVKLYLQRSGIAHYFGAVVGGEQVQHSKPAPDIFIAAAQALGLPATACAAVEDSHNGVRSAAAAGCLTLMVPDRLPATPEMHSLATVLPSLHDLPGFLQRHAQTSPNLQL